MPLKDTIADDYEAWDNDETVTLAPAGGGLLSVPGVLSRSPNAVEQQQLGGVLNLSTPYRVFHLPTAELAGTVPAAGDVLTDSNSRDWRLVNVDLVSLGTRWRALGVAV